jgi:hypothetical protein
MMVLLLARPFLDDEWGEKVDGLLRGLAEGMPRAYGRGQGRPRVDYPVPEALLNVPEPGVTDDLARLYPLWWWSETPSGRGFAAAHWKDLRSRLRMAPARVEGDCGNARLAGLMAYCRLAKAADDAAALMEAWPLTREAMRARVRYELAHPRGGLIGALPRGAAGMVRWRRLTPDVARLLAVHARPVQEQLMRNYVDHQRPGWWIAWNVEQLMRNEVPFQSPTTPREIFAARALVLDEPAPDLARHVDLPWCRADEYYIEKLALTLRAQRRAEP